MTKITEEEEKERNEYSRSHVRIACANVWNGAEYDMSEDHREGPGSQWDPRKVGNSGN